MRAPVGIRIRRRRLELKLSQAALAREAGISASYLNLIENNKRDVGGALLLRIAGRLGLDLEALSGAREQKTLQTIQEALGDPVFQGLDFADLEIRDFVARFPEAALALTRLHRAYADANAGLEAYASRLNSDPLLSQMLHEALTRLAAMRANAEILGGVEDLGDPDRRRFTAAVVREAREATETARSLVAYFDRSLVRRRAVSPLRELEDAIIAAENHFPALEAAAEALRAEAEARSGGDFSEAALEAALKARFGVACRRWTDAVTETPPLSGPARYDPEAKTLWLRASATVATRRFQLSRRLAHLAAPEAIEAACAGMDLLSAEAKSLAREALASYVAGAMAMPYEPFLKEARARRYDVDLLSHIYGVSFEQAAHRLVTLRRKGAEGTPFGFLRADVSGRLTKRFPLPGLPLPGAGGHGCLLWPIYAAMSAQGVVRRVAEFPNGARFLLIAKAAAKRASAWDEQPLTFSIMLACDLHHADGTVYAQGMDLQDPRIRLPVGPSCRLCVREDCAHRQEPPPTAAV